MSTAIGAYSSSYLNSAQAGYAASAAQSGATQQTDDNSSSSSSSATNVMLSDVAKAYLAKLQADAVAASSTTDNASATDSTSTTDNAATDGTSTTGDSSAAGSTATDGSDADASKPPTLDDVANNARTWLNDQYASLGISSAMLDGKVAVGFSSQSRATLSAIASNADKLFSSDEVNAATTELQSRFNSAMASHVVIARHTGDYASLYQAASDYLDQAGPDEQATTAWKDQKQAVTDGLAQAKASFGKAPATGNANDPVASLLATSSTQASANAPGADATTAQVATYAHTLLDNQENAAKDSGKELVFDSSRNGQMVDLTNFDNRTLATIVLNTDSSFSGDEVRAAKNELDQRTRTALSNAMFPTSDDSNNPGGALGLMQAYSSMSDEEKAVLGVTQDTTNRILQSYKVQQSVQNSLAAYL